MTFFHDNNTSQKKYENKTIVDLIRKLSCTGTRVSLNMIRKLIHIHYPPLFIMQLKHSLKGLFTLKIINCW